MEIITDRKDFVNNRSHESLFIEAGAGAGKSTTMVDKIVHNILHGVSPEKIVAITFTNKSAEDLLIRVTKRIDDERKKATGEEQNRLNEAFYSLYKMKISTIHSFCYKVLSEYSFDAKIPFGVALIEEDDLSTTLDDAFNKWIRTLEPHNWQEFDYLTIALGKSPISIIKDLFIILCTKMMPDMEIVNAEKFNIQQFYDELLAIFRFMSSSIESGLSLCQRLQKDYDKLFTFFTDLYPKAVSENDLAIYDFYKHLKEASVLASPNKGFKTNKGLEIDANEKLVSLYETYKAKLKLLETYFNKDINDYAINAYEFYLINKNNDLITNNELIYKTYDLIKNNEKALMNIANQYDVIYVDEFQDTDKYQIEIVKMLCKYIDKRKKPGDVGSLVVVGDPKQSIYRFRGADFDSYMGFKNEFPTLNSNYKVVCLPDNFRSCSLILDWVNDTYSKMNFYQGYTYSPMLYPDNHKLIDYKNNSKALAGVYMRQLHDKNDYSKTAELVDYLVKNRYQIMVANPKDNKAAYQWKDIEYSDFMVIFASKTHLDSCAKAFAKRGIPYDITGKLEISGYEGIRELARLINYLLLPTEENKKTAFKVLSKHIGTEEDINLALDNLFDITKEMSSYAKVYYVFTHYDEYVNNLSEIDLKGIQSAYYQILENIFRDKNMSANEIIEAIFALMNEYQDTALAINRDNNAVRIMNAHQTKGLEANIVIYVSEMEKSNPEKFLLMDGKLYLNCLNQHLDIAEIALKQDLEEGLRKEYVVSTRARQVMIFDEILNGQAKGTRLYNIADYPYDWSNLDQYHINEIPTDISCLISDDVVPFKKNNIAPSITNEIPQYVEMTPSQLEARKNKIKEETIKNNVNRPKDNLFGTMLHRCNELLIRNNNIAVKDIVDMAMKENDCDKNNYRKYLSKCLFATKELFDKEKVFTKKLFPEYKFYCYLNNNNEIPVLMNGSIDLLMEEDDKYTIFDYKSDSADYQNKEQFEKLLVENYRHQLEAYKRFLLSLHPNAKVDLKIIWYEEVDDNVIARTIDL